jgi:hypothetical protein
MSAPRVPFDGSAEWVDGSLRVLGKARFPSAFCTATLEPAAELALPGTPPDTLVMRISFGRDKEPYTGEDLVGPVAYYARNALARRARAVQVHVAPGHVEELPIRRP